MTAARTVQQAGYSGVRPLSSVLEQNRVMRASRRGSLGEAAADCVYTSTRGGQVTAYPVDRRTDTRLYFAGGAYVKKDCLERDGYAYVQNRDGLRCAYASPGLAEALAGESLPRELPDGRDEEDKARDDRRAMRRWYASLHEHVDRLSGIWGDYDTCLAVEYITGEEAAVIHGRIDHRVKADGYWDDGLPAEWWRREW